MDPDPKTDPDPAKKGWIHGSGSGSGSGSSALMQQHIQEEEVGRGVVLEQYAQVLLTVLLENAQGGIHGLLRAESEGR